MGQSASSGELETESPIRTVRPAPVQYTAYSVPLDNPGEEEEEEEEEEEQKKKMMRRRR